MQKRIYCKTSEVSPQEFKNIISNTCDIKEIVIIDELGYYNDTLLCIIDYCKNNSIPLGFITKGIRESNHGNYTPISKEELQKLKKLGVNKMILNFQDESLDMYSELYNSKSLEYAVSTLIQSSILGLRSEANYIPLKTNYMDFYNIVSLLSVCLVQSINVLEGKANNNLTLSSEECDEFKKLYKRSEKEFRDIIIEDNAENILIDKSYIGGTVKIEISKHIVYKFN